MEQLVKQIVAIDEEWRALLQDDTTPYDRKRVRIHELAERNASLFAKKRAMSVARYTKNSY